MIAFDLEGSTAVWTRRARVEKRVHLSLEHAVLDGFEELLRLRERQTQMLKASRVFLQGDDIGDGFFLAIIITNDKWQFDVQGGCSSGSGGGEMREVILPEFVVYPQHLHSPRQDCLSIDAECRRPDPVRTNSQRRHCCMGEELCTGRRRA
jgi:hypothetical protein